MDLIVDNAFMSASSESLTPILGCFHPWLKRYLTCGDIGKNAYAGKRNMARAIAFWPSRYVRRHLIRFLTG